ncbi:MAG TPA: hypothetical protein VMW17_04960 [Candidatus Binatia bacterium]|nr:hypothetical protein [Candidatus Binatia bacterium]
MTKSAPLRMGAVCALLVSNWCALAALAVQAPVEAPPVHERQCVATGDVPAGGARRVTVKWSRPFPSGAYNVIGSVSDAAESEQSIELSHVVTPYTPDEVTAVVFNRDLNGVHAGLVCLDASRD